MSFMDRVREPAGCHQLCGGHEPGDSCARVQYDNAVVVGDDDVARMDRYAAASIEVAVHRLTEIGHWSSQQQIRPPVPTHIVSPGRPALAPAIPPAGPAVAGGRGWLEVVVVRKVRPVSTGPAALVGTGSPTIIVVIRPGVMAMAVFLAVLVVVMLLTGVIDRCVAARLSRTPDPDAGMSTALSHLPTPAGSSGGTVEFDSEEELAETVLVASRLGGYVSARFYQRAMASLAAQDEARHGTTTLPESGI